jgi:hypothetical protein
VIRLFRRVIGSESSAADRDAQILAGGGMNQVGRVKWILWLAGANAALGGAAVAIGARHLRATQEELQEVRVQLAALQNAPPKVIVQQQPAPVQPVPDERSAQVTQALQLLLIKSLQPAPVSPPPAKVQARRAPRRRRLVPACPAK